MSSATVAPAVRSVPTVAERVAPLRCFVSSHRRARELRGWVNGWVTGDGGLADSVCATTGDAQGRCYRDLGDVTPYLWLLGDEATIRRAHGAADGHTSGGLLCEDGRIHSFDNHDYVLSFHLLHRLTGEPSWRAGFLERCAGLRDRFFTHPVPPAWVGCHGGTSHKASAFTWGLLELFALAHADDADGGWLDPVADQMPLIDRMLHWDELPVMPRVALRAFGRAVRDPRPGTVYARLFKDNSNLAYALMAYVDTTADEQADRLLRELLAALGALFFDAEDGWARTEVRRRSGALIAQTPSLIANAVAVDLELSARRTSRLGGLLDADRARRLVEAPLARLDRTGLLEDSPGSRRQHLDMTTDFVTAAFRWLIESGERAAAAALLDQGLWAVERHLTPRGLAIHAGADGAESKICVKYNLLVLKLAVCEYLLDHAGTHDEPDRDLIAETFLIDR